MQLTTAEHEPARSRPQRVLAWFLGRDRWTTTLMLTVFAVLIGTGTTSSSLGIDYLQQDGTQIDGLLVGEPREIRFDEYNVSTPMALSILATRDAPAMSPLAADANVVNRYPTTGVFESFVFFDSTILRASGVIPENVLFAAHWWLPFVLLFLSMPRWFELVGGSRRLGWVAALLITFSPSVAWWSLAPVDLMAFTLAGSTLMLAAFRRWVSGQRLIPIGYMAAAGILIAGIPTAYVPWSFVLGVPILIASTLWVLGQQQVPWRQRLSVVGGTAFVSLVFGLGTLLENASSLGAMLGTVYPGSRRATGKAQPVELLFNAPGLGPMQGLEPLTSNQSELSTSWTIAFLWATILVVAYWAQLRRLPLRTLVAPLTICAAATVWLLWSMLDLGTLGERIPLLNYVMPDRAAQVVGILCVLAICLLLGLVDTCGNIKVGLMAALSCAAVTAYAVSRLIGVQFPDMPTAVPYVAALGVAVVVYLLTVYPRSLTAVVVSAAIAAIPAAAVNPLVVGTGDLRASPTAQYLESFGDAARENGTLWASDYRAMDILMLASGVPALSGLQRSGPDVSAWERLDPTHEFEEAWNRGGGRISIQWRVEEPLEITSDGYDLTTIEADPCELAELVPELTDILSRNELSADCLTPVMTVTWAGNEVYHYAVS